MSGWLLFIFLGAIAALAVAAVTWPLHGTRMSRALSVLIPLFSLGLYLMMGRPDLPSAPAMSGNAAAVELKRNMLLAQRPMDIILHQNPDDPGALASLAEINVRLGQDKMAEKLYARAIVSAKKSGDPRAALYQKSLDELKAGN